jgi:hypothetical protein
VRELLVQEGLKAALERRASSRQYERILDGKGEAHLIAEACSPAPEGRQRWTLKLLANRLVELEVAPALSESTLCRILKKMSLSLG